MEIFKEFTFQAAHRLPHVPPTHKCHRLHGHTFTVALHLRGPVQEPYGWVMDFADIAQAWEPLHQQLDHNFLNEVEGLSNPTSENLARWIWRKLRPVIPTLYQVVLHENTTSGAIYRGEDD